MYKDGFYVSLSLFLIIFYYIRKKYFIFIFILNRFTMEIILFILFSLLSVKNYWNIILL